MILFKSELELLDLISFLVYGNHATTDDIIVVKHSTHIVNLRHLSEWRFYATSSYEKINSGRYAPYGSISVDANKFEAERDRYIREFSNSKNMLEKALKKLNVSYEKGKEFSDIGTFRKRAVTSTVCLSCVKECTKCHGRGKVKCFMCGGSGKQTCTQCSGRGGHQPLASDVDGFGCRVEFQTCTHCHGSGKVDCSYCSGSGYVKCGKCSGTGVMTHYLTVTGYADSNGKTTVVELTEVDRLLNQYITGSKSFKKLVKSADFSLAGKSFPQNDIAHLKYLGVVETADLTFSLKGHNKEYRLLSFGTPAELFMTCNLYDDLLAEEIKYVRSQVWLQNSKTFLKNDLAKLERLPAFYRAFTYLATHKEYRDDPKVGQYFSDSCHGCISSESARILGLYSSKILNSISATRNRLFTLIAFCLVFAVFAVDDEHFFEINYSGKVSEILSRYSLDLVKAILIFFVLLIINRVILHVKNIKVRKEYRQACREYYFIAYLFFLHVCMAVSFTYGIFAHKGDVPAIGNAPYALKKEYVDPYITDPAGRAWDVTVDLGNSYVVVPVKKGIDKCLFKFYDTVKGFFDSKTKGKPDPKSKGKPDPKSKRKPDPKSKGNSDPKLAKDKRGKHNSQVADTEKKINRNSKPVDANKKNNQK